MERRKKKPKARKAEDEIKRKEGNIERMKRESGQKE